MAGELILIVEDNENNMKLVRDLLGYHGYRTLEAVTGEEGVALAREHLPALILMDIQLPGIDGIEAFEQLASDPATRDIPVIAVTASAMQEERARIETVGFAGYQPKPIQLDEFMAAVEEVLQA
ncbi:MAG: response regulator [Gammaproteobacteria bacterium]|nr:response regulator [Gammaproteobacteria bacterium]NIR21802.1 response regulator [Gammaproteobacteria bacterium]NIS03506.1 response regulator [Gammaproteobacteria bacterium]NIU39999.1 response regulator [Gammaproteobacteria bacterium]NIV45388.1 response regulator [Gammaproteobacteria bacterium]